MFYFEIHHEGEFGRPILSIDYKTYRGALNRILKDCHKPRNTDYKRLLASTFYYVIRDDLNRVVCNCHYANGEYIVYETDNIGRFLKETIIKND